MASGTPEPRLAAAEVVALVERVRCGPITFQATYDPIAEHVRIQLRAAVTDSHDGTSPVVAGQTTVLNTDAAVYPCRGIVLFALRKAIAVTLAHQVDEWFELDGEHLFNPHDPALADGDLYHALKDVWPFRA